MYRSLRDSVDGQLRVKQNWPQIFADDADLIRVHLRNLRPNETDLANPFASAYAVTFLVPSGETGTVNFGEVSET